MTTESNLEETITGGRGTDRDGRWDDTFDRWYPAGTYPCDPTPIVPWDLRLPEHDVQYRDTRVDEKQRQKRRLFTPDIVEDAVP